MDLQSGQNAPLAAAQLEVRLSCDPAHQAGSLDASAFLLNAAGRVPGDEGFVFYGQPNHPSGAVRLGGEGAFAIDLTRMPAGVERIVLAWSIDSSVAGLDAFARFRSVRLSIHGAGVDLAFPLATDGMRESALVVAELYLRNGQWKVRAVGQGFAGGLAPLAKNYGVDVADSPGRGAPAPAAAPPPPPPPAPPSRIDLRKREPISLEKKARGFGTLTVNLNWSRGQTKRGFFGGTSGGIDLDLGCMVELADGDKDVVQALGNRFGQLGMPPFAKLLGDDRSGESSSGETLLIDGDRWSEIRRVLVFSFIYEGVPNWAAADAVVTVTAPGQPELIVRLDEHASGKGMCAIALLENVGGGIRVTKVVEYFASHEPMDRHFGFGFRWKAGQK